MIRPFDTLIPEFRPAGPNEASPGEAGRIGRKEIHSGRIVRLSLDSVRFPGGGKGELEFIRHRGAAAVLPFLDHPTDPDPRILMVRQYRYAAGGHLYEIPAGMPEGGYEPWEVCARRELAEETGCRTGRLRYLGRIFTTPGFTDEVIHLFAAADLREGEVDRDDDEFIEVGSLRLSRALEAVRAGIIVDAKTVATLLFAGQFLPGVWEEAAEAPPRSSAGM